MFSWLFGGGKKKKRKSGRAKPAKLARRDDAVPVVAERKSLTGEDRARDSRQIVEKMGGPDGLAQVIKHLLAEDKMRR